MIIMQQLSLSRIAVEYIYHICPKLLGGSVTFTSGTELAHSTDSQQVAVPKCAICTKSVQEMWKFHSKKEREKKEIPLTLEHVSLCVQSG